MIPDSKHVLVDIGWDNETSSLWELRNPGSVPSYMWTWIQLTCLCGSTEDCFDNLEDFDANEDEIEESKSYEK